MVVLARQLGATFQLTGMTCLWPKPPKLTTPRWAPDWTAAWHTFLQELLSPLAAYFPEDSEVSVAFIYNTVEVSTHSAVDVGRAHRDELPRRPAGGVSVPAVLSQGSRGGGHAVVAWHFVGDCFASVCKRLSRVWAQLPDR